MNALAPTAAAAAPLPFGQVDEFTAALMAEIDSDAKAAASKTADRFRFKDAGEFYIRLAPSKGYGTKKADGTWNTRWFHSFGTHAFKPPGADKKVWFGCTHHSYGQACPLCAAVAAGKNNPATAEIADEAYASRRYLVSGQFFDQTTRTFGPIVPIELAKTQFEKIKTLLLVSKTFFALQGGYVFKVTASPRSQGAGMEITVSDPSPFDTGVTADDLLDLEEIVANDIIAKNNLVSAFTGNLLQPLPPQPGRGAAGGFAAVGAPTGFPGAGGAMLPPPSAAPMFGAPAAGGFPGAAPAVAPVAQPAYAPQPAYAAPAQQPVAQAPVIDATPVAQPAYVPSAPVAAAVAQPAVAAQPAPIPAAAPVQPAASSAEALAAELDSILNG